MGFQVSWIAVSDSSSDSLLRWANKKPSGERHEFNDTGWYLLELTEAKPKPWCVLIADGDELYTYLEPEHAQSLSIEGQETLYFYCSDRCMVTSLQCFEDGNEVWAINYECDSEQDKPEFRGQLPSLVGEHLQRLRVKQEADDTVDFIYDLTAEVGRGLTGFRHDMDPINLDTEPFQVLVPEQSARTSQSGWLKRVLRRFGY